MLEAPLSATLAPRPRRFGFGWVLRASLPISLIATVGVIALVQMSLEPRARLVFFGFSAATVLWCTTKLNSAFVALAAVVFLVVTGGAEEEVLLSSLASDVIWLMIGAFIVAAAMRESGLAERVTRFLLRRARTVSGAFWWLTLALIPMAAFFPSTTGRAAIALPIYHETVARLRDKRTIKAFSLLIPAVTLMATSATLIAASSHLILNELLAESGRSPFSYATWAFYGAPFATVASLVTCGLVLRLLLDRKRRIRAFSLANTGKGRAFRPGERLTLAVCSGMVLLWATQGIHQLGVTTVTLAGAVILCTPKLGCISWKKGLLAVSWNLVLFVGAVTALGKLLLDSGVVSWLLSGLLDATGGQGTSALVLLVTVAAIAITSHLYIPSHTTRVVMLIPPLLVLAQHLNINATALAFVATLGTNYCLTLPIHSKALLLYQELDQPTFEAPDMLRLTAVLLPVYFALLLAFYFFFWRFTGLAL